MKPILIGLALAVIALVVVGLVLGSQLGLLGKRATTPTPSPSKPSQSVSPTTPPPKPSPTVTVPPTAPTPVPTSPGAPSVNFELAITNITGTGLSRTVTAQVKNTGSADARSASGKVEVYAQGQRVKVSGQDSLAVSLGDIKAGATVTKQVTLTFTLTDGLRLQNGGQVVLSITSNERTQTLTYDFRP